MGIKESISELRQKFDADLSEVRDSESIEKLRVSYLGKKGSVTELLKGLKDLSGAEKKEFGQTINTLKREVDERITAHVERIRQEEEDRLVNSAEQYDVTLPMDTDCGSYHPITLVQRELEEIFASMGFTIEDYREVVTDYNCFEALNIPKHHPARDMQDTYYLDNGQLMLQPSNTPNGNSEFSAISAKYEVPILFYNHCDYVYREQDSEEEKIKKVDTLVDDFGYNFVQENQLAKMTAAAYNSRVSAKWDNDTLYLSAAAKKEDIPLYDKNYQNSTGVKVIFADGVTVDEFNIDASVAYKKDNCIYASLDKGVKISKNGENKDINITSVNVPAKISKNDKGATIKFCDGGMMTVEVAGNARTTSKGWETTQQEGKTLFRKYGKAETLKITK